MMNAIHEGVSRQCIVEGILVSFLFPVLSIPLALPKLGSV